MDQITQEIVLPIPEKRALLPIIPFHVWIVLMMVIGFAVINIGVRGLARYPSLPVNPFAEYADIFPGQPKSAVEARGFICEASVYNFGNTAFEEYCGWKPESDVFSSLHVVLYQQIIQQVSFTLRDKGLRVGDIAIGLETSNMKVYPGFVYFMLPSSIVTVRTTAKAGRFSPYIPVWRVTFSDPNYPIERSCIISAEQQVCSDDRFNTRPG